jgi:hypothetical protein
MTGGNEAIGGTVSTGGTATAGGTVATAGAVSAGGTLAIGGSNATGGSVTGGSKATGGGLGTGGTKATGGTVSAGGTTATGGMVSAGGSSAAGGTTGTAGTGPADCPNADPTEFTRVTGWLKNTISVNALPSYAYSNIKTYFPTQAAFDKLVCSIVMSCTEWAPSLPNWLLYCEAVVTSAIVSESSYNPNGVVVDTYATRAITGGTANDPTIGLLQDRLSSTANAINYNAPIAKMTAIGCNWPPELLTLASSSSIWATGGGTTYLSFMEGPACNIGMGTWFYFSNATGNGGATVVWTADMCAGKGITGNMIDGLLSHLQGGNYTRPADPNNSYVTGIKARFALLLGGLPSADPFTQVLQREPTTYCK